MKTTRSSRLALPPCVKRSRTGTFIRTAMRLFEAETRRQTRRHTANLILWQRLERNHRVHRARAVVARPPRWSSRNTARRLSHCHRPVRRETSHRAREQLRPRPRRQCSRPSRPTRRVVFVANPNNPTARRQPDELRRFVEAVPPHVLLALDEAYIELLTTRSTCCRKSAAALRPTFC